MYLPVRRGRRAANFTAARRFGGRARATAALVVLSALLADCQTATVVTSDADAASGPAPPEPLRARIELESLTDNEPIASVAKTDEVAVPTSPAPLGLVRRVSAGLKLRAAEDSAIDRELDWYVANADYLNRVLHRSERYLYHIVEALERHDMPLDFALLPIVESAYDPFAYSRGQAAGLWQIIPGTGRDLGLRQNWWYDARRDVLESTEAALHYLRKLHEQFDGDWLLAVAGYNAGGGSVSRAMRRAEAAGAPTDFWGIRRYLPAETQAYVPRLLALSRLIAEPSRYGVSLRSIANEPHFRVIETGDQIDMALAAQVAGMSTDELYRLNPGVNRWATDPDGPHRLLIPVEQAEQLSVAVSRPGGLQGVRWTRHVVRAGETLSHLAVAYRTTSAVLQEVNGLPSEMIRVGQGIMVPQPVDVSVEGGLLAEARTTAALNPAGDAKRQAYVVQAGDSLWSVSRRYGVEVADLATWNAMSPEDVLSVGRELVVWSDHSVFIADANQRIRRITYTVRKGDSLSRISSQFRVSVAELLQWNDISPERYLQPGQQLIVFVDVTEQST